MQLDGAQCVWAGPFRVQVHRNRRAEDGPVHRHSLPTLLFVCEGTVVENSVAGTQRMTAGDLVWRPRHFAHCCAVVASSVVIVAEVIPAADADVWRLAAMGSQGTLRRAGATSATLAAIAAVSASQEAAARLRLQAGLLELLAGCDAGRMRSVPDTVQEPAWLRTVKAVIDADLGSRWSVPVLSRSAGVSESWLRAAFRRHHGMSVFEYVRSRRLQAARRDLIDTDLPIGDIASKYGFADQSHLSRMFKATFGVTPQEHRKVGR